MSSSIPFLVISSPSEAEHLAHAIGQGAAVGHTLEMTLDVARAQYVADLQRVHPHFDEQMSDVLIALRTLLGEDIPSAVSPLDTSRADYVGHVRDRCDTLVEQVLELAKTSTQLFAPALGLIAAA